MLFRSVSQSRYGAREGKIQEALENVGRTYEDRINAKYDAELSELENKKRHKSEVTADMKAQEPTETPKLEALKAKPTEALKDVESTAKALEGVDENSLSQIVAKNMAEKLATDLNKEAGVDLFVARKPIEKNGDKYVISQINENGNTNTFVIEDANGTEVGKAQLSSDGNYLENIRIDGKYRRKGLATEIYNFIEARKGIELIPSPIKQSKEAKALWEKRSLQKSISKNVNAGVLAKSFKDAFIKTFYPKSISEAYHKAKADGSNPELVKAVEDEPLGTLAGRGINASKQKGGSWWIRRIQSAQQQALQTFSLDEIDNVS